jgi:hypothetical protein
MPGAATGALRATYAEHEIHGSCQSFDCTSKQYRAKVVFTDTEEVQSVQEV